MYILIPLFTAFLFGMFFFANLGGTIALKKMEADTDILRRDVTALSAYTREVGQAFRRYGRNLLDGSPNTLWHARVCTGGRCTGNGNHEGTTPGDWTGVNKQDMTFCRGLAFPHDPQKTDRTDSPNGARLPQAFDFYGEPLPACASPQSEPFNKSFSAGEAVTYGFANILYGEATLLPNMQHYTLYTWIYEPRSSQGHIIRFFDSGMIGVKKNDTIFLREYPDTQMALPAAVSQLIPDGAAVIVTYPIPDQPGWRDDSGD